MDIQENIDIRLWDYIDGLSSPKEKSIIEELLENNRQWKEKYIELLEVYRLMQSSELEEPSMRFSKNVMEHIAKFQIAPATRNYINNKIIWGIAAFFILLFTGFLIYGLGQLNWKVDSTNSLGIDFTKIDYSKVFSNTYVNIFMMINVVLGLFLIDRYLTAKRNQFYKTP